MQCIYHVKKSIFLYLKYVAGITLLGISFSAFSSDDINYDPYAQVRAEQFEAFTSNTVSCMEVRVRGALLQGIRDSEKIVAWIKQVCGPFLRNFMIESLKRPAAEADEFIHSIASRQLRSIPGLSFVEPSNVVKKKNPTLGVQPAPLRQFMWNKPAVLKGILMRGKFSNCCTAGLAENANFYFVRLEKNTGMTGENADEDKPNIDVVREVQIESSAVKTSDESKIGKVVRVSCIALIFGNTGHYARPVYCEGASVH
ncbi:hypothetical protein D3C85_178690 [compost metagenome]